MGIQTDPFDDLHQYNYINFFSDSEYTELQTLNLLPAFEATTAYPLTFRHDGHWNADGHELVAQAIADYLIDEGMIAAKQP